VLLGRYGYWFSLCCGVGIRTEQAPYVMVYYYVCSGVFEQAPYLGKFSCWWWDEVFISEITFWLSEGYWGFLFFFLRVLDLWYFYLSCIFALLFLVSYVYLLYTLVCAVHSWNKDGFPWIEEATGACRPHCLSEASDCLILLLRSSSILSEFEEFG
jgi:hypothetical protein